MASNKQQQQDKSTPSGDTAVAVSDNLHKSDGPEGGALRVLNATGELATQAEAIDYSADAGAGMEHADADSIAIPFIAILQPLSPAVVDGGMPAGRLFNTVTGEAHETLSVIPVYFRRLYKRWLPREVNGGGYRGEMQISEYEALKAAGKIKEVRDPKKKSVKEVMDLDGEEVEVMDSRDHYVLIVTDEGELQPALISCSRTQIRRSKMWLAMMNGSQMRDPKTGQIFRPATYAYAYRVGPTEKEKNDQGSWFSFTFAKIAPVDRAMYQAAKEFHAAVAGGKVRVVEPTEMVQETGAESQDGKF